MNISSPHSNDNGLSSDALDRALATKDRSNTQNRPALIPQDIFQMLAASDQADGRTETNLNELRSLVGGQALNANDNDTVVNQRGAPSLYRPSSSLSMSDLAVKMALLGVESSNERQESVVQTVRATSEKIQKNTASRLENQKLLNENLVKQANSNYAGKIFSWIGKVAAVIGAAVAVGVTGAAALATGGAAVPLLAISTMALVAASMSLADQVSQELGGPQISLQNLITSTSVSLLTSFGVDHDAAVKTGNLVAGIAGLTILGLIEPQLVGTLAQNVCEMAGVSPENAEIVGTIVGVAASVVVGIVVVGVSFAASGGLAAAPLGLKIFNGLVGGASSIAAGVGAVGKGTAGIVTAVYVKEANYIQADNADLELSSLILKKQIDNDQETIKNLMQSVEDGMRSASQIIKELFDSLSQISNNISRRAPV